MDTDVVIVGGGPAGVIAAIGIAREGFQVTIIDRKPRELIGDKNCGDALDSLHTGILEREMGILPPSVELGEARTLIDTITIASGGLETKLSASAPAYQVNRLVYGQRLLRLAEDEGVQILDNSPVRGVIIENNQVMGVKYFDQQRMRREIQAKITIDASGFVGAVRKEIPENMRNGVSFEFPKKWSVGTYREIIKLKNGQSHQFPNEIVLLYHKDIPPPGYAWIFSEGSDKLNLGVTWVKSIDYPVGKSMKTIYHDVIDQYIPPDSYEVIKSGGGNIPGMPNFDTLVVNGAMIVGDAGGLADPTTFEGHGPALESGRLAAISAVKALRKNDYSLETLWSYNKSVMSYLGRVHAQSFLVSRFISEMGVDDFSYLLGKKLITEQNLIEIFQEKRPVGLRLKMNIFLKSFPKWGLMFKLAKVLPKIEKIAIAYERDYPDHPSGLNDWQKRRDKLMGYSFS